MTRLLKTELWKAFHNPMMWLALAGGSFLILASVLDSMGYVKDGMNASGVYSSAYSLFVLAMPYFFITFSANAFMYVWPILAAMPYGSSYMQERRSGVYNQIVSRVGRRRYFIAKYVAVFIAGGAVVALTHFGSLLADALVIPYWKVSIKDPMWTVHPPAGFLSELYYQNPWLHAVCWSGVMFLLGGSTACLTFFAWTGLRLRALVTLIPFAIYFMVSTVVRQLVSAGVLPYTSFVRKVSSLLYIVNVNQAVYPGMWRLAVTGILAVITFAVGYFQVVKHELD